ncbi:hypothetical protein V8E51_009718 [Hyaloscypha variabilis]
MEIKETHCLSDTQRIMGEVEGSREFQGEIDGLHLSSRTPRLSAPFYSAKRARPVNITWLRAWSTIGAETSAAGALGTQTRHETQNSVGRVALEQSSLRDKLQQGLANRINPLETYSNLLLHRSGASGLAPLYVRGQCERLVAQDSSLRPPSLQRAQSRLRSYNDLDGSGAGRLVCERRVWAHGGRTCRYWGCSNLEDEMSGAGGDLSSLVSWLEHAVLDVLGSCSICGELEHAGEPCKPN